MGQGVPPVGSDPERAARLKARVADLESAIAAQKLSPRDQARMRAGGVDQILREVLAAAQARLAEAKQGTMLGKGRNGRGPVDLAVIGTGGYGRAELSPRSDVDVLFLVPGKDSRKADTQRALIEQVLYALWDSGLEIGHSVRTIAECVAVGKKDVPARSSLLDHRFVAGDRDLYADFADQLETKLFKVDPASFVGAKLLEIAKRRERWGAAVSRNEPNLKEGEGGLRDAHTALWIARAVWGIHDAHGLVARGLARPGDVAEFDSAFERLLEVRSVLHKLAGRKEDRLGFDRQEPVARALGFADSKRGSATELFMQSLTQSMAAVQRFLQLVVDRMPDRFHKKAEGLGLAPKADAKAKAPKGFGARRGRLLFADPEAAAENPVALIQAFVVSAQKRLPLHPEARDLVRRERDRIVAVRGRKDAVEAFFELLLHHDPDGVERALLEMNDLGALGAFLPEFDALYYRVQHDTYHVYTCDAHLIIALANVHRLLGGRWEESEPNLTQLARKLPLRTLALGVLLHDIGKSERGHTEAGLRMLPSIAKQLRMTKAEEETVHFLIEQHLLMSHVAQRRDLSDPHTIADFAQKVGSRERLDLLAALTFCDIQAVGPGTWSEWKGALLRELHAKASRMLTEGADAVADEVRRRADEARHVARKRLQKRDEKLVPDFEVFLAKVPDRYFAHADAETVVDDFLLSRMEAKQGLKVGARVLPERKTTEVTFQAPDRPGLFADFTGALAAAGLSIRTARIHTVDGMAIDRFEVIGGDGGPVDLLALDRMVRDLLWVLTGKQTAAELLAKRKPATWKTAPKGRPARIEVHDDVSPEATVVDVYARDRLGLLHDIARTFHELDLDIQVAIVSTKVDQAADSFYVREQKGGKLTPEREAHLKAELTRRIE